MNQSYTNDMDSKMAPSQEPFLLLFFEHVVFEEFKKFAYGLEASDDGDQHEDCPVTQNSLIVCV